MQRIRLIDAGGTISSVAGAAGVLGAGSLVGGLSTLVPESMRPRVDERVAYRGLSETMDFADVEAILTSIAEAQADPAIGAIVVAHGTDMMEEVAFLAALMRSGDKPVLFTGAQRAPAEPGFDGIANLRHAVQVAAAPAAARLGTAIVFAGRVLDAQRARKMDSAAPDAFGPAHALIGQVDDLEVRIFATPARRFALEQALPDAHVAIVPVALASTGAALGLLAQSPMQGLVLEAPGRGNAPPVIVDAVARAVNGGLAVLLVSACAIGGVAPLYESGAALVRAGAVPAADLDARKARLLLGCALGGGRDRAAALALVNAYLESA